MSSNPISIPGLELPKGGGAIQGLNDSFQVEQFSGTASFNIPLPLPEARALTPQLNLTYNSTAGNGVFGMGFSLSLPAVVRNTNLGVPQYRGHDVFSLAGAGNLVPALDADLKVVSSTVQEGGQTWRVTRYMPDNEQQFQQIFLWENEATGISCWKVTDPGNTAHVFGQSDTATVSDPDNPQRIFQWNIESSTDVKGNKVIYTYVKDVSDDPLRRWTNTYLTAVKYGNYMSGNEEFFAFEISLLYEKLSPLTAFANRDALKVATAPVRNDAFSSFKSGFEIRTARLCYGILVSHFFKGQYDDKKIMTTALTFSYNEDPAVALSLMEKVTQSGYEWVTAAAGYKMMEMPPLELHYTTFIPDTPRGFGEMTADGFLPIPGNFTQFQLVDLHREGLPGILLSNNNAHLYWEPEGNGRYAFPQTPAAFPIDNNLDNPNYALIDIDGNGGLELVVQDGARQGYYQYNTWTQNWEPFIPFGRPLQGVDVEDRTIIDLNADGKQDVLIATQSNSRIFFSDGEKGYQFPVQIPHPPAFPYQYNNSRQELITFAGIFGDGMNHCVRVRNGLLECWPSLGDGRFAPGIALGNAPRFDGAFDKERLFFTDVDGSGTADIAYVYPDRVAIYVNLNGNSFADPFFITLPDTFSLLDSINFADILGIGMDSLVFTKMTPEVQHFYYDFSLHPDTGKSVKPYLLQEIVNNLGAVRQIEYNSSTFYYLQDKSNGRPWVTTLPFPVHVVSQVVNEDKIAGWASVQRYAYHDGFFNGAEREFGGFGFIESWDGEPYEQYMQRISPAYKMAADVIDNNSFLYAPVKYTKTWYSIGEYPHQQEILKSYQQEFFSGDPDRYVMPPSVLSPEIDQSDERSMLHVYQVLNGKVLHEEIYGLDNGSDAPYTVSESNFYVRQLQPRGENRYPVLQAVNREILNYQYERESTDPRAEHDFVLITDEYGNTLEDCKIFYGRRPHNDNYPGQDIIRAIASTHAYNLPPATGYLIGVTCELKTYSIDGMQPAGNYFTFAEALEQVNAALANTSGLPMAKLTDWQQNYFWNEKQDGVMPLRELTVLSLLHHQQNVVFLQDYIENVTINNQKVITAADLAEGGYLLQDGYYWNPGMIGYYYTSADAAYYLPYQTDNNRPGSTLPLQLTRTWYDDYQLLQVKVEQFLAAGEDNPLNHITTAVINYNFLKETRMTDINGNIAEVMFDPLGNVIVTTTYKWDAVNDSLLEGDEPLRTYDISVLNNVTAQKVIDSPATYLQQCSSFFYYDLKAWQTTRQPVCSIELSREIYVADGGNGQIFQEIKYNDGSARELETKVLTAPGLAFVRDDLGRLLRKGGAPVKKMADKRWTVNGKVIYNNKGNPAMEYVPYFSNTWMYEEQTDLADVLPPPKCLSYDATDREIRTDVPKTIADGQVKGFYTLTVYKAWEKISYDKNDTVMTSSYYNWFMKNYPVNPTQEQKNEKDALDKAALCENTPSTEIFNNQGNTIFKVSANLGQVTEAAVKKLLTSLPAAIQDDIWQLFKSLYLTADNYLNAAFRPYDPLFRIPVPAPLEPYTDNILAVQEYLTAGGLTAHYELDIKGRVLRFTDPRFYYSNMRHGTDYFTDKSSYALNGEKPFLTDSCDSGQQLSLSNIFENPFKVWDARGFMQHTVYDELQRVLSLHVSGTEIPPDNPPAGWKPLVLDNTVEMYTYGEGVTDAKRRNLFGQPYICKDQAGRVTYNAYTLNNKATSLERVLLKNYDSEVNWSNNPELETIRYVRTYTYTEQDAILTETDLLGEDKVFGKANTYNESGAVMTVNETTYAPVKGASAPVVQPVITAIEYYPNKQPVRVTFGNGMRTDYAYEYTTQRMISIRSAGNTSLTGTELQQLQYTYDPMGNITRITDNSFTPVACYGTGTDPIKDYWYDPLYQLVKGTGRQHVSLNSNSYIDGFKESAWFNFCPANPDDANLLVSFTENYLYDFSGNLYSLQHITGSAQGRNWTRNNAVNADNNHLSAWSYDRAGNQLSAYENSAAPLSWSYRNMPSAATLLQRPDYKDDTEYYSYDASGTRVRRVITTLANGNVSTEEYIYLDGWNIKRRKTAAGEVTEERYTSMVAAEQKDAAIIYYWKISPDTSLQESRQVRFQLNDLEGTICVEVDIQASRITYEEFLPFGESAFVAGISQSEMKLKDYRFVGKERDDTTGLDYVGARYYASWMGRWISADPKKQFASAYTYSYNNPVTSKDPNGQWAWLIPIIIGGLMSSTTVYNSGRYRGETRRSVALRILMGFISGSLTGALSYGISGSGSIASQTLSMIASSTIGSYLLNRLTFGRTDVNTSFGVGGYNWTQGRFDYLGRAGNTLLQNIGYLSGLLVNISDARALNRGINAELVTEFPDVIGHSAIVNPTEHIDISVGPMNGGYYAPQNTLSDTLTFNNRVVPGQLWENYHGDPNGWSFPLFNINGDVLRSHSDHIATNTHSLALPYSGLSDSCATYTYRALWDAGVIILLPPYAIHPVFLPIQLILRQIGISVNPFATSSASSRVQIHEE
ncbi:hypothetical protein ECE50_008805 [Chitinophaga sp. Mgbs1]|uniref:Uncharacterized protein n=1 Tax=Chitinophaga solisilvae TaxID=1233460 RepID=A0A3S1BPH6_9BACT|nr:hypothetical protein [Chitinophaga solisilvae]